MFNKDVKINSNSHLSKLKQEEKIIKKKILMKNYSVLENVVINDDLQVNNSLIERGIYLIEVENGVLWGYDSELYEMDEEGQIVRKPLH